MGGKVRGARPIAVPGMSLSARPQLERPAGSRLLRSYMSLRKWKQITERVVLESKERETYLIVIFCVALLRLLGGGVSFLPFAILSTDLTLNSEKLRWIIYCKEGAPKIMWCLRSPGSGARGR